MTRDEPTRCRQCGAPPRIAGRSWPGSTAGPVEHVKTGCGRDHWFTATFDSLDLRPAPTAAEPPPVPIPVDEQGGAAMRRQPIVRNHSGEATGDQARERVLAGIPLTQRRRRLAGVTTALLEGGDGPPVVLLHGQGGWAAAWLPIIPNLVQAHRVVVPDLPGLGASETPQGPPDTATVLAWLDELIDATCTTRPVLVGASLGGSIAARFAARHSQRLARLVLVDTGCLAGRVRPAPSVLLALVRHSLRPSQHTMLRLMQQVTVDLDRLRKRLGERWEPFLAYSLDRARTPSVQQANRHLLRELGWRQIPPQDLEQIAVPTTLIWGRQDRVMPLRTAQQASVRYGWPLQVIDDAGHFLVADQPEAFLAALQDALGDR